MFLVLIFFFFLTNPMHEMEKISDTSIQIHP